MTNIGIEDDSEFYAYLKRYLPRDIKIDSEPCVDYFSEFKFHYKLYINGQVAEEIKGDFRKIQKGELVKLAIQILKKYSV
jgi:hypothetical protein